MSTQMSAEETVAIGHPIPRDEDQPKFPWHVGLGLMFGGAGWMWAFQAVNTVLLPAKIGQLNPEGKVAMVAWVSTVTMIISLVAGIIGGALSDRTRTRFGSRTPWVVGGVVVGAVLLVIFTFSANLVIVLVCWWLYGAVYNVMLAAGAAWQPDLIAKRHRGTASSLFGIGNSIGLQGAQIVAGFFVTNIPTGVMVALACFAVLSLASALVCREPSNVNVPVKRHSSVAETLQSFLPPRHAGRDYWLAAFARFLWMVPGGIGTYRLYTLTDYMNQSEDAAGKWMSLMATASLVLNIICCIFAGPLADRFHSVKKPLVVAIFFVGLPCLLPLFIPTPEMYTTYVIFSALGGGVFVALDQTIMTSVLPDPASRAKDLAFLNSCGVLGNLCAPLLGGWIVSTFGYAGLFPMGFVVLSCAAICVFFIKKIK